MLEGTYLDPKLGRIPFREWVDQWLATTMHLRPSRARSEGIVRNQLIPRFGDWPLHRIRPTDVRAFVSELAEGSLAPGSVRKVYNVFRAVLRAAEESGLIGRSPCVGISLPPVGRREMRFLSPEEILRLTNEVPERFQALILVAAYGGLRFGEIAGVRLDRIDFLRSRLIVTDAIIEVSGELHHGRPRRARTASSRSPGRLSRTWRRTSRPSRLGRTDSHSRTRRAGRFASRTSGTGCSCRRSGQPDSNPSASTTFGIRPPLWRSEPERIPRRSPNVSGTPRSPRR